MAGPALIKPVKKDFRVRVRVKGLEFGFQGLGCDIWDEGWRVPKVRAHRRALASKAQVLECGALAFSFLREVVSVWRFRPFGLLGFRAGGVSAA